MRVERIQIPERPLIDAYRNDFARVAEFFQYNPKNPDSFKERYDYLRGKSFPRPEVVEALTEYNASLGAGEKTMENLQRLRAVETVAVITGQQAGVLTGPLYTIYKALTVVQLAAHLTLNGMPAVPVFWIASEDHDFLEISSVTFLNREHVEVTVTVEGEHGRQPAGRLHLQAEVGHFLDEFAALTPDTDFKPAILEKIRSCAAHADSIAHWFALIMAWLLEETGLIFLDALDPGLRKLGKKFFIEVLEKNDEISACLGRTEKRLAEAGFPIQVQKNPGQVHLFLLKEDGRYPLEKAAAGYTLRGHEEIYSAGFLRELIEREPENISTNVVTRPLLQDLLLPNIAYVGGPGETAYYAQYREIYGLFALEMPIIYPRASLTLVEKTIAKALDKYAATPAEIFADFDEIRKVHLAKVDYINIPERFNAVKRIFVPEYQKLIKDLHALDPKFRGLGVENLDRIVQEMNYLEEKAYHQHRKNCEDILKQLDKIKVNLLPGGNFQERTLNIFAFLFKYQTSFINLLTEVDFLQPDQHLLVYL